MTPLARALADYLSIRRAMGYKLKNAGGLLAQFVAYLEKTGADTVTTDRAVSWAMLPQGVDPSWWGRRLSAVRGFAAYMQTIDPATEVPPTDLLPIGSCRATPYLYSGHDIASLIAAAATLRLPLRAATYHTLIGVLAVTGLRIGEALRLDRGDIDWNHGLLLVRDSKFGKSREIPLHETTLLALHDCLRQRDRLHPAPGSPAVFITTTGNRLFYCDAHRTFQQLVLSAGLTPRSAHCRPRLHDLRHTFAVRTLIDAYRSGGDVQSRLTLLSTYLGHADPAGTYWYLSSAPELLALAAQRLEDSIRGRL
jgi:integrase/recombinase XerD